MQRFGEGPARTVPSGPPVLCRVPPHSAPHVQLEHFHHQDPDVHSLRSGDNLGVFGTLRSRRVRMECAFDSGDIRSRRLLELALPAGAHSPTSLTRTVSKALCAAGLSSRALCSVDQQGCHPSPASGRRLLRRSPTAAAAAAVPLRHDDAESISSDEIIRPPIWQVSNICEAQQ